MAKLSALPIRSATGVGARVALQRGPILRTGKDNISWMPKPWYHGAWPSLKTGF